MAEKQIKIHNKSDRPDNIIEKENEIFFECEEIEKWRLKIEAALNDITVDPEK